MKFVSGAWAAAATAALLSFSSHSMAEDPSYEQGLEAASSFKYGEALTHFQVAAGREDKKAQRTIGLMLLYGERLYGSDIQRDEARARYWLQRAADNKDEIAAHVLKSGKAGGGT